MVKGCKLNSPGSKTIFCEKIIFYFSAKGFECINYSIPGVARTIKDHKTTAACTADLSTCSAGRFGSVVNILDHAVADIHGLDVHHDHQLPVPRRRVGAMGQGLANHTDDLRDHAGHKQP